MSRTVAELSMQELASRLVDDLEQTRRGEPRDSEANAAWSELTRRLLVYAASASRTVYHTQIDPEDIVQDVLMRLYDSSALTRVRDARKPTTYLYFLVRNAAYDAWRREVRRSDLLRPLADDLESSFTDLVDTTFLDTPVERQLGALDRALLTLAREDRRLLRLRFWEGKSTGQIAEALGINYSAAAVRIHRLLKRLKTTIENSSRTLD
jgi:RNA polymerase sigma factor (sigma-70 family)